MYALLLCCMPRCFTASCWAACRTASEALAGVQGSRDMPAGYSGLMQCVTKVSLHPDLGVTQPWDPTAVKVQEYYPGVLLLSRISD